MNSFICVCKSEFYKLRTQRSAMIMGIASILIYPGAMALSILILKFASSVESMKTQYSEIDLMKMLGWSNITAGSSTAGILIMILAVLYFTNEFQSGSIASTLISTPDRIKLYFAKFTALFIFVYIIGMIGEILAYLATIPFLVNVEGQNLLITINSANDFRYIFGGPLMLAFTALLFLAIGCLIRSTAASIVIYFIISLVLPGGLGSGALTLANSHKDLARFISGVQAFLPFSGTEAFLAAGSTGSGTPVSTDGLNLDYIVNLNALEGFLVILLWIVVLTFFAIFFFQKRDIK
jgi:hypothetical protein